MQASWPDAASRKRARANSRFFSRPDGSTLLLAVQVALLVTMTASLATRLWVDYPVFSLGLIAVTTAAWAPDLTKRGVKRWWFVYVVGIFAYTILRSYADETAIPVRTDYVIEADKWFFSGTDPVLWLQQEFFRPWRIDVIDVVAVAVHWSFFVAPHAAAVGIFIWRRDLFPRYAATVVLTMYVALVLFFLVPTAPPWLAGRSGDLPGAMRVMDFVGGQMTGSAYDGVYSSLGEPNSVAAMPSLHMGITFLLFLWAFEYMRRFSAVMLVYSFLMGVSLMYLAEHYMLDLIVGALCAVLCYLAARKWVPVHDRRHASRPPVSTRQAART